MRKELLEKYQLKAEELFTRIKELEPDKNLYDFHMSLLILTAQCPAPHIARSIISLEIVRLLDFEIDTVHNALLSEREKQENNPVPHEGTGKEKDGSV